MMVKIKVTELSITDRAKKGISFAFQQPVRFKGLTVKDLITLAKGEKIALNQACSYLSEVGLVLKIILTERLMIHFPVEN